MPTSSVHYIDRWRLNGSLQPFRAQDVRMYGFLFRADPARINALTARYLARPVPGLADYPPSDWLPLVLLTFTHIGKLYSLHSPYRDIGWTSETEAAFWLFAPDAERSRLLSFVPYAFVDKTLGVMHGREIYGTPRDVGWFGFPRDDQAFPRATDEPQGFTLDAFGAPGFGAEVEWLRYRLLSVERDTAPDALAEEWQSYAEASRVLLRQFAAHPTLSTWVEELRQPHVTSIFLKQLYDAADSSRASYQALVEATTHILEPPDAPLGWFRRGGPLRGRYAMDLQRSDTHPIAPDLGLLVGTQPAEFAFWFDFDFDLDAGKETWRADESAPASAVATSCQYVDRWCFAKSPQPFTAKGVHMYGFAFDADYDKIQRLCDRYLNDPFDGRTTFRAFGQYVLLTFTHIEHMASQLAPYATCGTISETELGIWIPVVPEGEANLPLLVWFSPYMFVDNPLAVTQGRELYGFPKEQGRFNEFWVSGQRPRELTVAAQVVECFSLNPQPHSEWQPLLSVTGTPHMAESDRWADHADAVHHLNQALARQQRLAPADFDAVARRAATLWPPHGTQLFLKQFPDAADGGRACYQALVGADSTVSQFHGGWFLGDDYTLTVHPYDSHPLFADLGLTTGMPALLSYWLDFDFVCAPGKEVVRAVDPDTARAPLATGLDAVVHTLRNSAAAVLSYLNPTTLLDASPLGRWLAGNTATVVRARSGTRRFFTEVPRLTDPPLDDRGTAPAPPVRRRQGKRRKK